MKKLMSKEKILELLSKGRIWEIDLEAYDEHFFTKEQLKVAKIFREVFMKALFERIGRNNEKVKDIPPRLEELNYMKYKNKYTPYNIEEIKLRTLPNKTNKRRTK